MGFSAEFRCASGCAGGYPLDQVIYRCPRCGGLLEVVHDLAALRARGAAEWKQLFEARWRSIEEPWGSGVWGKHEWVAPGLAAEHIVTMFEGATPMTRAPRLAGGARARRRPRSSTAARRTPARSRTSG